MTPEPGPKPVLSLLVEGGGPLKHWSFPALLMSLCLLLALLEPQSSQWLQYDRGLIGEGQWWRILTGNLVHLNISHLALNLTGLLIVWLFFGAALSLWEWTLSLVVCSLGTGLGLWFFNPELLWYVGLSGAIHGLLIAGALRLCRRRNLEAWLLLILVTAKLAWEQFNGPMPGSESAAGGHVIVDSHLWGALAALPLLPLLLGVRPRQPTDS